MNNDMLEKLKEFVKENYKPHRCGWTYERSEGNYCDVFEDGFNCGQSLLAYEISCILGMELEEPEEPDYEE